MAMDYSVKKIMYNLSYSQRKIIPNCSLSRWGVSSLHQTFFSITESLFVRNKINCLIFDLKKKNQWPNKAGDDFPWICKFTYTRTKRKRTTNCNKGAKINHPRLLRFWFSHILVHQWFPDFSAAITCAWHLHDYIYVFLLGSFVSTTTSKLQRDEAWSKSWVRRQKKCTKEQTGKAEDENNEGGNFFFIVDSDVLGKKAL